MSILGKRFVLSCVLLCFGTAQCYLFPQDYSITSNQFFNCTNASENFKNKFTCFIIFTISFSSNTPTSIGIALIRHWLGFAVSVYSSNRAWIKILSYIGWQYNGNTLWQEKLHGSYRHIVSRPGTVYTDLWSMKKGSIRHWLILRRS